ncbi:MAG: 3-coathanger stack domain-containing protein [Saprospiraceae bacterium]
MYIKKIIFILFLSMLFAGNESLAQTPITGTISYDGSVGSGTYRIFRSPFNSNINLNQARKPIILVEGFDPNGIFGINALYGFLNPPGNSVADQLHAAGHDIIILNFDDGGDFIQRNAFLLVELIEQLNAQKPNDDPVVVVGFSMGGLVARYALTYMEESNIDHETVLYVSYDSPHKGAHVPLGIQALGTTFDADIYLQLFPDLKESLAQFSAPAAKQMLKYRIEEPTHPHGVVDVSTDHQDFLDEIEGQNDCNGYPSTCRNIGISLGSWNGVGQRSLLDLDNDGVNDLQHAGMPMLYVNFDQNGGGDNQWVWELNTCELISAFGFQAFMSTVPSTNYPHFDERETYGNLGGGWFATYWYSNQFGLSLLPQGAWSRLWSHPNEEPTDFAPGGFVAAYEQLIDGLNSQINCSFALAENSTFVPTVSALAYNTDDLFHNIAGDPDQLSKTPFDEIIGVTGDNRAHDSNVTGDATIVAFLVNEIITATNSAGPVETTCVDILEEVSGTVSSGQVVLVDEVEVIEASNYTIQSGATVDFKAAATISLLPGFTAQAGSSFNTQIVPCSPKACAWEPELLYEITVGIQTVCFANGIAIATVGNGVSPYTYTWSNGVTVTLSSNSHSQSNLGNGNHAVTVTDANGATVSTGFSINCFVGQVEQRLEEEEFKEGLSLQLFPNPATDQALLIFESNQDGMTNVDLYNLEGILLDRIVQNGYHEKGVHQISIPLATYPRGVYLLKIQHKDRIKMQRIILK